MSVLLLPLQLQENWKLHKPRVASYWLVKLDSIKRRKVRHVTPRHVDVIPSGLENVKTREIFVGQDSREVLFT